MTTPQQFIYPEYYTQSENLGLTSSIVSEESTTYRYTEKSVLLIQDPEDLGSIADAVTESDDYGSIAESELSAINDNAFIYNTDDVFPYGTVEFSGSALSEVKIQYILISSGSFELSGTTDENNTFREIGSGSFSAISGAAEALGSNPPENIALGTFNGTKVERSTFSYNERSALLVQDSDDFGSIADAVTESDDYGSIIDSELVDASDSAFIYNTDDQFPFGTVEISGSAIPFFEIKFIHEADGTVEFSGVLRENNTFREIGSGTLSAISGAADALGSNPPDQTLLGTLSGTKIEKTTFRYTEKSIVVFDGYEDYGTLSDSVTYEDYGSLSDYVTYYDNGLLPWTETTYPYGSFSAFGGHSESFGPDPSEDFVLGTFSGTNVEKRTFGEIGSGSFSAISGAADALGSNPPENIVLGTFSGTKVERNVYSYNERAIFIFDGYEDYGSIASSTTSTEDYGALSDSVAYGEYEDYGLISPPFNETTHPFGTVEISGSALTEIGVQFTHIADGTVEFSGVLRENNTFREIGSGTLSAISGAADALGSNPPENIVLGTFSGTKVEKSTFSYNERSALLVQDPEDLGSIADAVTESDDYGSIIDSELVDANDYAYIYSTTDQFPFGTVEISGSALSEVKNQYILIAEGTVEFSGVLRENNTFREIGSGSFSAFSGSGEALGSNPPDQTLLFEVSGTKVERNVYSYNERAIFIFDGYEDYGTLSDSVTYEDYGSLSDSVAYGEYEDYGLISSPFNETTHPFGTIEISGSHLNDVVYVPSFTGSGSASFTGSAPQSFTPATEIGSGTLSAISGAADALGSNPPDQTLLGTLSGTKIEKSVFREIGSGSATFSGTSVDRKNPEFAGSGTVEFSGVLRENNTFREIGSGSFSAFSGSGEALGSNPPENIALGILSGTKVEKSVFREIGSGSATFSGVSTNVIKPRHLASGSVTFSGSAPQSFIPATEIGSGTLSAISGAAEALGSNPPDQTLLFEVSGTKVEKSVFREIGSGSATFFGTSVDRKNPGFAGRGTVEFSGSAPQSFIPTTEIGSGSFSAFGGHAESLGANPPENIALGTFSGTKVERGTFSHFGSGTIRVLGDADTSVIALAIHISQFGNISLSGSAAESFIPATEIGSGTLSAISGAADALGSNPPENIVLFNINGGYNNLKAAYAHEGSGTVGISGAHLNDVVYVPSFTGSGTLSAISGAADSTLVNPPDQTLLFEISGTTGENNTFREIGSGSFSAFGGHSESFGPDPSEEFLIGTFAGTLVEKSTFSYSGTGTLSAISGAAEALGSNPPENIALGTFNGTKVERSTFREIGSGSFEISGNCIDSLVIDNVGSGFFSAISGAAEALGSNPPDNTALVTFSGTKVEKSVFREIGSGSATFLGTMLQDVQVYVPNYNGSGVIPITGNARGNFVLNYRGETQIDINGSGNESITPEGEIGGGIINIGGVGIGKSIRFKQPYVFVTII